MCTNSRRIPILYQVSERYIKAGKVTFLHVLFKYWSQFQKRIGKGRRIDEMLKEAAV
jgi:hypothetical protein